MGAYKEEQICNDFDIVSRGIAPNIIIDQMKILALSMLKILPDNQGRDFAFSNLLYTAEFIKASMLEDK